MMTFFVLGNICGISTYEKLLQERKRFPEEGGDESNVFCRTLETNPKWEWCPGEGGIGSRAAGQGQDALQQCPISQKPHGSAR